uniref:Uncharacterized protein n=1 Tax=Cajanus cajan TaxID=3821 RepID=A0A151TEZ4_CAJCA|nr:hypothetical protein KK1_011812 [Cajanus cajan]
MSSPILQINDRTPIKVVVDLLSIHEENFVEEDFIIEVALGNGIYIKLILIMHFCIGLLKSLFIWLNL